MPQASPSASMLFDTKAFSWGDQKDKKLCIQVHTAVWFFHSSYSGYCDDRGLRRFSHFLFLVEWNVCPAGFHVSGYPITHSFKTTSKRSGWD
ncbi:hypothetical protein N7504_010396 [Penicillium tannophilum]|nr:hypothetical protein N7504_010396 [Penicillium tannophilum]